MLLLQLLLGPPVRLLDAPQDSSAPVHRERAETLCRLPEGSSFFTVKVFVESPAESGGSWFVIALVLCRPLPAVLETFESA